MARLARRAFHASLEETLAWLDHLQSSTEPEPRELLIFGREVLPRFARLLPELVEAVNDDEAEAGDAPPATRGREAPGPAAVELISARVRRAADRDETERQCIGPVVGRLGGCAGRGAATDGWQPESAENFASKRGSRVQARCKACDGLRMRPKPAAATRRSAGARHWCELAEQVAGLDDPRRLRAELVRLSPAWLEDLRRDWWARLELGARRLVALRGGPTRSLDDPAWLAIDVDRRLIVAGDTPEQAARRAREGEGGEERLLLLRPGGAP